MANSFASDGNCVALYRMENGYLTTDSKGTNTLTNLGGAITVNTSLYKEGTACGDFPGGTSFIYRTNANLSSNFPFKSGTSNLTGSFCAWVRFRAMEAPGVYWREGLIGKASCFGISAWQLSLETAHIRLGIYDGVDTELYILTDLDLANNQWYHVGVTYNDTTKAYRLRVWDDIAATVYELTGTGTLDVNLSTTTFDLGLVGPACLNGLMDEVVVFNDELTADEIDEIRQGIYGEGGAVSPWLGLHF